MRIGFIGHAIHRNGGMERAAAEVLDRLSQRHDIVIAAENCELTGPRVHWLRVQTPRKPALFNAIKFRAYTSGLRELRDCDVVGSIGAAAVEADVVVAQFCHAAFTARFGGLRGGRGIAGRAWQRYVQGVFGKHEQRTYTSRRLRRVIAVSRGTARELSEYYGVDPSVVAVIPNGVDHNIFKPAGTDGLKLQLRRSLGIQHDGLLAIFVGGDWGRKGVADAIRGVARVKDVHLAVVGRWDAEPYRAIARDEGVEGRIYFPGGTREPQKWLAAGDVFVFPSRYEAFSLVTIEAAACGLPIIATKINGTEELIQHGTNGLFIEPEPDDIASKLARLRDHPSERTAMGTAALQASLTYSWEAVADAQAAIYEAAAQASTASA